MILIKSFQVQKGKDKQNCVKIEYYQNDFKYFQRVSKLDICRDIKKKNG